MELHIQVLHIHVRLFYVLGAPEMKLDLQIVCFQNSTRTGQNSGHFLWNAMLQVLKLQAFDLHMQVLYLPVRRMRDFKVHLGVLFQV